MNLFEKLFTITDSAASLDSFLSESMQSVNDFYNSEYISVSDSRDSIERFILFKSSIIEQLDYKKSYNRAFISILLDFCERFNFIAATPKIYSVLEQNDINIGHRLQAALLFLYNIDNIPTLVGRFDLICQKLQTSIELEEDNDRKALSTFLNYFSIVIRDTQPHVQYALEVKSKIEYSLSNNLFPFLNSEAIVKALKINLNDADVAFEQIQTIIDYLLDKKGIVKPIVEEDESILLIENDTEYSKELTQVYKSFNSIRAISVKHSDGKAFTNRGVKILESEEELFAYMRRVGNMHEAKLKDALESIPQKFPSKIKLIDWGCGQGIASMVFLERFGIDIVNSILLIEPSEKAIKRASLHIRKFDPLIPIRTICKELDKLTEDDLNGNKADITIHLFSNILDIDDYSQNKLIELIKVSQSSENYFVCVSPYIDDIKTDRVDSFKRYFENNYKEKYRFLAGETNSKSDVKYWNCNNNYNGNFNGQFCPYPHPTCGCDNQWTRVIRVFKIEF